MNNQKGQSTIEMLLTLVFSLGFILLFIKLAYNMTNGYLVHYAVFMASRSYMVHEDTGGEALRNANKVFAEYKPSVWVAEAKKNGELKSVSEITKGNTDNHPYTGVFASFKQKFSLMKMIGGEGEMDFFSESFLGREPSLRECMQGVCDGMSSILGEGCSVANPPNPLATPFDNGC